MDAWGRHFTDDADFVTHTGGWWKSNQENVAGHKEVPDSVIAQKARYRLVAAKISFLKPDVALVHATWEGPGSIPSPAEAPVDRKGIITMVMTKPERRWLIRASQNTRVPVNRRLSRPHRGRCSRPRRPAGSCGAAPWTRPRSPTALAMRVPRSSAASTGACSTIRPRLPRPELAH
jgi:uncharacterized protein (TIGR02246 family)